MVLQGAQLWSLIFVLGGIGATARVLLGEWVTRWGGAIPHLGTWLANVVGCFAIGVVTARIEDPALRRAIAGGLLGGFTTFSAFALLSLELWRAGAVLWAAAQVLGHVLGGVAAVAAGLWLGRSLGPA